MSHKYQHATEIAVLLIIIITVGFSIVYSNVQSYDPKTTPASGYSDTTLYLDLYFGEAPDVFGSMRWLVPSLAHLMPDLPPHLFSRGRSLDKVSVAVMKFGMINFLFLIATCLVLYEFQRGFGMTYYASLMGVLLFLGSKTVVRAAGLPMADTAFFFFFMMCVLAIHRNNALLLFASHTAGVLAKELVVLSAVVIIVADLPWRRKIVLLLCLVPGMLLFLFMYLNAGISVSNMCLAATCAPPEALKRWFSFIVGPNAIVNLFLSFGLLWIPAIYALSVHDVPVLLKRGMILVPVILFGMMMSFSGNASRHVFDAFVFVIPLAVEGLGDWLRRASLGRE